MAWLAKAEVFFERADKAAKANSFDYAVDMYIEGLACAPDAMHNGHIALRQLALLRQVKGGKKPSMLEKVKRLTGKTPLKKMLNAEYLFSKDPDHLPYAEALLKAASAGGYEKTTQWIADLVFQANNAATKPSFKIYMLLKGCYVKIKKFDKAIAACQQATRLKPSDGELAEEFKTLSAELAVSRGKYDQEGDFRKSMKDREKQENFQNQASVVKTENYRASAVEQARKNLVAEPQLPRNIFKFADALAELQADKTDKEAIQLLENAYKNTSDFSFQQKAGNIKIDNIKRKTGEVKELIEKDPQQSEAKVELGKLNKKLKATELEHYRLCIKNYPTDLLLKYEYGSRLLRVEKFDEAIPFLQEAQREPKHKISAMSKVGMCFFMKGWYADAIDIFTQAFGQCEIKDGRTAKELRYNLARSYEKQGDAEKALEIYRKIAQLDFGYKDIRQRVDKLRNKQNNKQ